MASTLSALISVTIRQGPLKIVQQSKIVQIQWESSFGDSFLKSFECDATRRVLKVYIS